MCKQDVCASAKCGGFSRFRRAFETRCAARLANGRELNKRSATPASCDCLRRTDQVSVCVCVYAVRLKMYLGKWSRSGLAMSLCVFYAVLLLEFNKQFAARSGDDEIKLNDHIDRQTP